MSPLRPRPRTFRTSGEPNDLRDVVTGEQRRLTNHGYPQYALASTVSRDGRQVAYFWMTGSGVAWQAQLRVVGIDGRNERVVMANPTREIGYLTPYDWTPDGRHVLVVTTRGDKNDIAWSTSKRVLLRSCHVQARACESFLHP